MDNQISGLAGEYFVAAELLKREYQVAMTIGTAKSVDLMVYDPRYSRKLAIQVKTLRHANCFDLPTKRIDATMVYVFLFLHNIGEHPEYFILLGSELLANPVHYYGSSLGRADGRETVNYGPLKAHKDRWDKLDQV